MNIKKIEKDLKKVNGKRRERILTLNEIISIVEKEVKKGNWLKKNNKYIEITNICYIHNSYNYKAIYTKFIAILKNNGDIKDIDILELNCKKISYGSGMNIIVNVKNIDLICNLDLSKISDKVIKCLQNSVIEGLF